METRLKKYPRTLHLPFSEGVASDDKKHADLSFLDDRIVVITEKRDGENTTIYRDYMHARSLDSKNHPSRNWVKKFATNFQHDIPETFRICGENLYAKHSVEYDALNSYFECFSIWDGDKCLSWDQTVEYCNLFGIQHVPIIYIGKTNEQHLKKIISNLDTEKTEGIVVRLFDSFQYDDFHKSIGKWVRKNHVQTDEHWMNSAIIPNKLKE